MTVLCLNRSGYQKQNRGTAEDQPKDSLTSVFEKEYKMTEKMQKKKPGKERAGKGNPAEHFFRDTEIYDLIIVGAGASGLTAAITASGSGLKTLVLEHNKEAAKKILSTGNGRCNFTNKKQGISCYRCSDPAFIIPALSFGCQDAISFFREKLHLAVKERNGYYYPRSMQASSVRNALLAAVYRSGARILPDIGIRSIRKRGDLFLFDTKQGDFSARRCILACGGKAAPKTGSDGTGYIYARQLGHTIVNPLPALVPLEADADRSPWLRDTAGVRCDAGVSLFVDGNHVASDTGELQLTDYGISGIPVFQVSRFASVALEKHRNVTVLLDFVPEFGKNELAKALREFSGGSSGAAVSHPGTGKQATGKSGMVKKKRAAEALNGFLNQKLTAALTRYDWSGSLSDMDRLADAVKNTKVTITGTKSFDKAQVTCGGVDVSEVSAGTMESEIVKGLYFAGEMLDVDGICGGYNLQWAWSSGRLAGKSAAADLKRERRNASVYKQKQL